MSEEEMTVKQKQQAAIGRRNFINTVLGGVLAAIAGWISGSLPKGTEIPEEEDSSPTSAEARISALEAEVARLAEALLEAGATQPLGELEGEQGERVVFHKSELTIRNQEGVLLNLVAPSGAVGIRFYKDFDFGNEVHTNPWHMGYIEANEGYQCLAILRDWGFTAALWDADGRLSLGRLDPHPPSNPPAKARVYVRGTVDEVQTLVEASPDQTADIFQVLGRFRTTNLAVNSAGNLVIGSPDDPTMVILHDTQDGSAYFLKVTSGQLILTEV